ncbi:MAG TPA: Ig-like domain-containing protein, partial [Pirellulaceae bacterium]|nr:Ig-like domain-containing protein [Pirellulaceae bacterium]
RTDLNLGLWSKFTNSTSTLNVDISGDGTTWFNGVATVTLNSTYRQTLLDLDSLLANKSIALDSAVYLRFRSVNTSNTVDSIVYLDSVRITKTLPNRAPTLTSIAALSGATEDTDFTISFASLASAADEADADGDTLSFRVMSVASGTLKKGGVAVTPGATLLSTGESLVWSPPANANGALTPFAVRAWDGDLNSGTSIDVRASITAVNDAPVIDTGAAPKFTPIAEDLATGSNSGDTVGAVFGSAISDVDAGALVGIAVVGLNGTASGTWQYSVNGGSSWSNFGAVAESSARLLRDTDKIRFLPNLNFSGTTSLLAHAWDRTSGTAGSTADLTTTGATGGTKAYSIDRTTASLTVTPVNDAPSGADRTVSALEDGSYAFTSGDFSFSDTSDTPANSLLSIKIVTLPGAGALKLNGMAVTAGDFVIKSDLDASKLIFTPAANASGTSYASFTFAVRDDGGTSGGGVDLDPTPNRITIDVTSVNDAPSGTDQTVATREDTAYVFAVNDFGFSDPIDSPANSFASVKIVSLPSAGALTLNNIAVAAGDFVTKSDLDAGKLLFTPTANAIGAGYASFTFAVRDTGGTTNSGVDLDPTPNRITIDVTSVNDAPVGTDRTLATLEDTGLVLTVSDFGFSDPLDAPANLFRSVKIVTLPSAGVLKVSGAAVVAGDFVTKADLDAAKLVFTPAANSDGTSYASFTFAVRDDGGTSNG